MHFQRVISLTPCLRRSIVLPLGFVFRGGCLGCPGSPKYLLVRTDRWASDDKMKRWPIWKRVRLLWVLIATAGVVVCMASMLSPLAMVRSHSRTNRRLMEIAKTAPDATVPVKAYREACDDAVNMAEAGANGIMPVLIPGGLIVLLAMWGSKLNKQVRQMEEDAQPTSSGNVANRAAPEK